MKQFVGKNMQFFVVGMGHFSAKVVGDRRDMILVRGGDDEFPRRIIKKHIVSFMPMEAVDEDVNLLILTCENPTNKCPGVKYVKEGEGFSSNDFNSFMSHCPRRCDTCRTGSLGEMRTVSGEVLCDMMSGTVYGDYPEEKA